MCDAGSVRRVASVLLVATLAIFLCVAARANPGLEPEPGAALGRFIFTYYWIAEEHDTKGAPQIYVFDSQCLPVASISLRYLARLALEGTGLLTDGRLLNFEARCHCSYEGVACFHEVLDDRRWGIGVDERPLVPFRSVAVDNEVIATGTRLYVPALDGLTMPGEPPWGGFVHDGCLTADDRGSAIGGQHLDFFVARKGFYKELDHLVGKPNLQVYLAGERCP
jgi:3D (Asp-Asp-Asp) domain-containing protein